jgi:hypothetical protein
MQSILGLDTAYPKSTTRILNETISYHVQATDSSTATDLLCYFKRPSTDVYQNLTYLAFFSRFYIETLPLDDPLQRGKISIANIQTEQGDKKFC